MGGCMSKPPPGGGGAAVGDGAHLMRELEQRLAAAEAELRAMRRDQQAAAPAKAAPKHEGEGVAAVAAAAANGAPAAPPPSEQQRQLIAAAPGGGAAPRGAPAGGPTAPPPPPPAAGLSAVAVPPAPPSAAPLPEAVPMEATRIVMHQIVAPAECDGHGVCTGGQVLSWIDVCAGLSAKTLARGPCVTVSVDAVHFIRPCRLGQVVIVAAMVNRTFSSSMEVVIVAAMVNRTFSSSMDVGVRVEAEDMRTGVRYHCCSAYLTFVSLRSRGQQAKAPGAKPQPLPRIVPACGDQKAIYAAAESRRAARLSRRQSLAQDPRRAEEVENSRLRPVTHREGCPTLPPPLTLLPGAAGLLSGGKPRVSPAATTAYATQSIMPQHANTLGITFGGQVMSWMEQCAYISASRLRGQRHLTAGMDSVTLARTTKVGDVLYITAQVTAIFDSSLEVAVTVFGETPSEGAVFHCADACVTVVVVDNNGAPSSIPFALDPQTPNQQMRYGAALRRRRERLAMRRDLLREVAAKRLLDGSVARGPGLASYGSCNLLPPLAAARSSSREWLASGGSGGGAADTPLLRRSSGSGGRASAGGGGAGGGGGDGSSTDSGGDDPGPGPGPRPGSGGGRASSGGGFGGGGGVLNFSAVGRSVGVCPSPRVDILSPKSTPRSAPVSPAASPKAPGGGRGFGSFEARPQALLVGSLPTARSAHEYFDNW
ncbi:MAG: HotDog domain-containing protein [Monoraphidium minutum]|nr:MAG: HotDog domain-containing protein [Monoraphidium minutum]